MGAHEGRAIEGTHHRQTEAGAAGVEARIAASYNALLRSDPALAEATYRGLVEAHRVHGLMMRDRLLCNVLRPRFLTERRLRALEAVSNTVAAVFERAGRVLLGSEALQRFMGVTEQEQEIWSTDPGYPAFTLTSRLDSFMVGESPRFVEYNAESPAGIGYSDLLTEVFLNLPLMRQWDPGVELDRFHGLRALTDTMLWAYREWGGPGTPTICIVDWEQVLTRRDFEICGEFFSDSGYPTVISDPRSLTYRKGRLWAHDRPVDLVYRRVLLHELLERADEAADLLSAYRDGAVCMVNSPRSKVLHKKSVFALLSDRRLGLDVSPQEQSVLDESIPWTRVMAEGETEHSGENVDLVPLVLRNQDRFALKPVDDYGGKGVALGWDMEPERWEQAVEIALREPYVVQERLPVPEAEFPVWQGDHAEVVPLLLDTNPLMFRNRLGALLTRVSGSALLNVSAGAGSTAPTFVVREDT